MTSQTSGKLYLAASGNPAPPVDQALRSSKVALWEFDVAANRLTVWDAASLLGLADDSAVSTGEAFLALIWPEDRDRVQQAFKRASAGQFAPVSAFRVRRGDGSMAWCRLRGEMVRDARTGEIRFVGALLDVTEQKTREDRFARQQTTLLAIAKSADAKGGAEQFSALTEMVARALEVPRVSVWLFERGGAALRLIDLYDQRAGSHESGTVLEAQQFPAYFAAIKSGRTIAAGNALVDLRTMELGAGYLKPRGIFALLDACIRVAGQSVGVLCSEQTGAPRRWTQDERHFSGSVADLAALSVKVDELCTAQTQLRSSQERFERLFQNSPDWIGVSRISDGCVLEVNEAFEKSSGFTRAEVVGKTLGELDIWVDTVYRDVLLAEATTTGGINEREARMRMRSGVIRVFQVSLARLDIDGEACLIATCRDITERKQQVALLEHQATHDSLTGLPNRELLKRRIEVWHESAPDTNGGALLLIDLDRFKEINDTLGHHAGDDMLRSLAQRLRELPRVDESTGGLAAGAPLVARLGGDEFAIWYPMLRGAGHVSLSAARAAAQDLADAVLDAVRAPFEVQSIRLEIGASVGIALDPDHAGHAAGLLRCADVAMYAAKRRGQGSMVYDSALDQHSPQRLALMNGLGDAIRTSQLVLHFQPKAHLASSRITSVEALVRWQHPVQGLLPPSEFIPFAELSDAIGGLTWWVLDAALAQQMQWKAAGVELRMAVNFSARHLLDESCPGQIENILRRHGADPLALELEITESAIIADPARAFEIVTRIHAMGVKISIDDFGTGYSSLAYLRRLPVHALKIDQSFVSRMTGEEADAIIVQSTTTLAHNLRLTVVAEGVEDGMTLEQLKLCGCDEAQGYFIARPMPGAAMLAWLGNNGVWRA